MDLVKRKRLRLVGHDYSQNGAYFITICIKNRERILGRLVGFGIPDDPKHINFTRQSVLTLTGENFWTIFCYLNDEKVEHPSTP